MTNFWVSNCASLPQIAWSPRKSVYPSIHPTIRGLINNQRSMSLHRSVVWRRVRNSGRPANLSCKDDRLFGPAAADTMDGHRRSHSSVLFNVLSLSTELLEQAKLLESSSRTRPFLFSLALKIAMQRPHILLAPALEPLWRRRMGSTFWGIHQVGEKDVLARPRTERRAQGSSERRGEAITVIGWLRCEPGVHLLWPAITIDLSFDGRW